MPASARSVVAIASRELARAQAQARELGVERAHGSYEALLADPQVDAVYVSLPNELHHEWSMHALAAGKHVLCEKPYSRSPDDVQEAFAAADAAGVVLAEAFMWRHHPQTLRLASSSPTARSASCAWCARPSASCSRIRATCACWRSSRAAAPWTSAATASALRACWPATP